MFVNTRNTLLAIGCFVLTGIASVALAHPTANARRTAAQCRAGGLTPTQVNYCIACVQRPRPHHYHPLQRAGNRCDLNGTGR
ncbi:MAG: hypothetical protein IT379_31785 [Deltaproteobacteria bacterium]|nr:hypothetical protein [Deltaproteobacteria bacterium]